jgi:glycosyltransferase involved in cell wall biosynthesis
LDAVANQTVQPDEVIVVDNNSTDKSVTIAKQYAFTKVLRQKNQGLTYARNTGLDAAKSDILARIDADAVLADNWVERVKQQFADPQLSGISGLGSSDVLYRLHWPKTVIFSWLYFLWTRMVFRLPMLWGANMAIRRTTWHQIKPHVIMNGAQVHEDEDLSLCILEQGGLIKKDNHLRITIDGQTYHYFPKLVHYTWRMYNTRRIHKRRSSYQTLEKDPPRPLVWLLMGTAGVIIFPLFFLGSFLSFPVDWTVQHVLKMPAWMD